MLTKLLEAIGDMIVGTSRLVKNAFRLAFKLYFLPVVLCGKALRFLGIVGEFITLMVGLAWMLWPMAAPWYLANRVLYIPCIIATCVFIVTGWFALKNI